MLKKFEEHLYSVYCDYAKSMIMCAVLYIVGIVLKCIAYSAGIYHFIDMGSRYSDMFYLGDATYILCSSIAIVLAIYCTIVRIVGSYLRDKEINRM